MVVQATIFPAGDGTRPASITVDQLQGGGANCPTYGASTMPENGANSTPDAIPLPPLTWTVGTVLRCMDPSIDPSVNQIEVIGSNGSPESNSPYSVLGRADLASPSDYENTAENPVVSFSGTSTSYSSLYNRPPRTSSDPDERDELSSEGQPIELNVYLGKALTVTASASPSGQVAAGTPITFTAQAQTSDPVKYTWTFGDAASVQRATGRIGEGDLRQGYVAGRRPRL